MMTILGRVITVEPDLWTLFLISNIFAFSIRDHVFPHQIVFSTDYIFFHLYVPFDDSIVLFKPYVYSRFFNYLGFILGSLLNGFLRYGIRYHQLNIAEIDKVLSCCLHVFYVYVRNCIWFLFVDVYTTQIDCLLILARDRNSAGEVVGRLL